MAGKWRGWRLLVVGERRFRWQFSAHFPFDMSHLTEDKRRRWSFDTLTVRTEDRSPRRLFVRWQPFGSPMVTPGLVRACIDKALREGWLTDAEVMELPGEAIS